MLLEEIVNDKNDDEQFYSSLPNDWAKDRREAYTFLNSALWAHKRKSIWDWSTDAQVHLETYSIKEIDDITRSIIESAQVTA